jgi:hypothetical protein
VLDSIAKATPAPAAAPALPASEPEPAPEPRGAEGADTTEAEAAAEAAAPPPPPLTAALPPPDAPPDMARSARPGIIVSPLSEFDRDLLASEIGTLEAESALSDADKPPPGVPAAAAAAAAADGGVNSYPDTWYVASRPTPPLAARLLGDNGSTILTNSAPRARANERTEHALTSGDATHLPQSLTSASSQQPR